MPYPRKIYMDACCLNRPFDDQTVDRVRMEAESIIIIFKRVRSGKIRLIGSDVLMLEKAGVDAVLTTDDKMLKLYSKNMEHIKVRIINPINWIKEAFGI